jgi:Mce-associated membrane protein
MPDRPRNRPRIAGQRRTADPRTTDAALFPLTDDAAPEAAEAPVETPEEAVGDVATDTIETPEKRVLLVSDGKTAITVSDPEAFLERSKAATAQKGPIGVVLSALLAVLIVLVLAVAGIVGVKALQGKQAEDARGQAATAGRKAAEVALSYDYRSLDKSFAAARATMTPDFATKFDATAKVAGELATKTKATVRAEVREVGVRDGDANRVTLVIFVNQTTTSTITQGKPRVDLNRTRFTMVRNGDQWLVQEIAGL